MRQKELFDGKKVPAIWQGTGGVLHEYPDAQTNIWVEGIRYGCNAIDTSERYGDGYAETLVGKTLKKVNRYEVFVGTKVAPENLSRLDLIRACKSSLKRLDTDYIDLYQIHWNNPMIPLEETLNTMMELRTEGKIRYIGVCNFTLPQIEMCNEMLNGTLATVQLEYNLGNRLCERDIIPYCQREGILFLGYSPLSGGTRTYVNNTLKLLSRVYGRTNNQIVLNWLTSQFNNCVLPKTRNYHHLIENAQSTEFTLDSVEIEAISNQFRQTIVKLKPSQISCENTKSGLEGNLPAYKTSEEAKENKYNQMPSPEELSLEVVETKTLSKPLFIRQHGNTYELIGGNVRYWAWILAFGMDEEVECVII